MATDSTIIDGEVIDMFSSPLGESPVATPECGKTAARSRTFVFVPSRGITCGDRSRCGAGRLTVWGGFRPLSGNHLWRLYSIFGPRVL